MAVLYTLYLYREYNSKVELWTTFNEANVMSFCGWLWSQFPPGIFGRFIAAGQNLLNMLRAHTAVYKTLKAMPGTCLGPSQRTREHSFLAHLACLQTFGKLCLLGQELFCSKYQLCRFAQPTFIEAETFC